MGTRSSRRAGNLASMLLLVLIGLVLWAFHPAERRLYPAQAVTAGPTGVPQLGPRTDEAAWRSALALLAGLRVKGRAPHTGYERALFGPAWADVDRNGCDTRNDVLRRDLSDATFRSGTHDCVVISGQLRDPYTARDITFTKAHADEIEIDHVVALSDAWATGAQSWTPDKRLAFANDPLELLAVSHYANQAKGSSDAASWLPPYKPERCAFVARQTAIKAKYGLWVTAAEHDAIARVLQRC